MDAKDLVGLDKGVNEVGTINHLVWTSGDAFINPGDMNIHATDLAALSRESPHPPLRLTELSLMHILIERPLMQVRFWAAIQAIKSASFAPGGSAVITSGKSPQIYTKSKLTLFFGFRIRL